MYIISNATETIHIHSEPTKLGKYKIETPTTTGFFFITPVGVIDVHLDHLEEEVEVITLAFDSNLFSPTKETIMRRMNDWVSAERRRIKALPKMPMFDEIDYPSDLAGMKDKHQYYILYVSKWNERCIPQSWYNALSKAYNN